MADCMTGFEIAIATTKKEFRFGKLEYQIAAAQAVGTSFVVADSLIAVREGKHSLELGCATANGSLVASLQ